MQPVRAITSLEPPAAPVAEVDARPNVLAAWVRTPIAVPVVACALGVLHLFFSAPEFPIIARVGGAVLGTHAFMIVRRATTRSIPFVAIAGVTNYLFFGLAAFKSRKFFGVGGQIVLSAQSLTTAVWTVVVFLVVVDVAARFGARAGGWLAPFIRRVLPDQSATSRTTIRSYAVVSAALSLGLLASSADSGLFAILSLIIGQQLVQTLLFRVWLASREPGDRAWFLGYTAMVTIAGLFTGMLGAALFPILAAMILQWQATGRVSIRVVAFLLLAFLVLTPAKHIFRAQVWRGKSASMAERADVWASAVQSSWASDRRDPSQHFGAAADRLSGLLYVAQTVQWVPKHVRYSGSSRWKLIPYSYVPRLLWADKPDLTRAYNGEYGIRFQLQVEAGTKTTALNLPHVVDGYWAYGWWGVVAVGLLIGGLIGFYEGVFDPSDPVLHAIGMSYLMKMHAEAHLGHFFTGVPQMFLVSFIVLWSLWAFRIFVPAR